MGRQKRMKEDKPRGRNELVAESIENETGMECSRKHVSSHVQVLKKKLAGCPEGDYLKMLSDDGTCRSPP